MARLYPPRARTATRIYWLANTAGTTDTNSPAAKQEWPTAFVTRRQLVDLSGCTEARLFSFAQTPGFAGSKLTMQYSLDLGTTWFFMDGTADATPIGAATPQRPYDAAGPGGSAWMLLAAAAKTEVLMRLVTSGGDGVVDPILNTVYLEVR